MNHTIRILLALLFAAALLTACSGSEGETDHRLDLAEHAITTGDYDKAQSICDAVLDDTDNLAVSQLGRLSVMFMKLNEADNEEHDDVEKATRCYRLAFELNADSARTFYADRPTSDLSYVMMLSAIVRNMDEPETFPEEMTDSTYLDSIPAL